MKKNLLFVLLFCIGIHTILIKSSYTQWDKISNGIETNIDVNTFAICGNIIFAGVGNNQGVYRTTNNGTIWTQTSLYNMNVSALTVSGNYIFANNRGGSGVYVSTNNGDSWTLTALNNLKATCLMTIGNNILAGISTSAETNGVYLTTNNGVSWTRQSKLNSNPIYSLGNYGNIVFAGTNTNVWRSTDYGIFWSSTNFSNPVLTFATMGNNIFAGTANSNGVYYTTNNGVNWIQTEMNDQIIMTLAVTQNLIFAGTNLNGVYLSSNNGANWIQKNEGFNYSPKILSLFIANNYIFAGLEGNSVWRRSISEIIGINNLSTEVPSSFSLIQNYPNPFNPMTKIQFDISKSENIKITVFDVSGKELQVIVNERMQPGTYEVEWNGDKYSSGIYFYRMQVGNYVETRKMALMK